MKVLFLIISLNGSICLTNISMSRAILKRISSPTVPALGKEYFTAVSEDIKIIISRTTIARIFAKRISFLTM